MLHRADSRPARPANNGVSGWVCCCASGWSGASAWSCATRPSRWPAGLCDFGRMIGATSPAPAAPIMKRRLGPIREPASEDPSTESIKPHL